MTLAQCKWKINAYLHNFTNNIIIASKNKKIEIRLMPCMYLTHCVWGALGSFFFI